MMGTVAAAAAAAGNATYVPAVAVVKAALTCSLGGDPYLSKRGMLS